MSSPVFSTASSRQVCSQNHSHGRTSSIASVRLNMSHQLSMSPYPDRRKRTKPDATRSLLYVLPRYAPSPIAIAASRFSDAAMRSLIERRNKRSASSRNIQSGLTSFFKSRNHSNLEFASLAARPEPASSSVSLLTAILSCIRATARSVSADKSTPSTKTLSS